MNGQTALITGASSGIGAAIAADLAAQGAQLILVARSETALNQLADTLAARHGQRPVVIAADLAETGCGARLLQAVQARGLTVDILVNNAGFGTYGAFEALEPELEQAQIAVNIAAVVDPCHAFIPGMLARGRGRVLNIASWRFYQRPCDDERHPHTRLVGGCLCADGIEWRFGVISPSAVVAHDDNHGV